VIIDKINIESFAVRETENDSYVKTFFTHRAATAGVTIGFWDYFRVGAPLTVITLAFGAFWLRF